MRSEFGMRKLFQKQILRNINNISEHDPMMRAKLIVKTLLRANMSADFICLATRKFPEISAAISIRYGTTPPKFPSNFAEYAEVVLKSYTALVASGAKNAANCAAAGRALAVFMSCSCDLANIALYVSNLGENLKLLGFPRDNAKQMLAEELVCNCSSLNVSFNVTEQSVEQFAKLWAEWWSSKSPDDSASSSSSSYSSRSDASSVPRYSSPPQYSFYSTSSVQLPQEQPLRSTSPATSPYSSSYEDDDSPSSLSQNSGSSPKPDSSPYSSSYEDEDSPSSLSQNSSSSPKSDSSPYSSSYEDDDTLPSLLRSNSSSPVPVSAGVSPPLCSFYGDSLDQSPQEQPLRSTSPDP
jgi:hypothetical protein